MFSSTIIATIGRPTLTRSVESVLAQEVPVIRGYLTGVVWNVRRRQLPNALTRAAAAAAGFMVSAADAFWPESWRALMRPHTREGVS